MLPALKVVGSFVCLFLFCLLNTSVLHPSAWPWILFNSFKVPFENCSSLRDSRCAEPFIAQIVSLHGLRIFWVRLIRGVTTLFIKVNFDLVWLSKWMITPLDKRNSPQIHNYLRQKLIGYDADWWWQKPTVPFTHCLQKLPGDDHHIKALVTQSAYRRRSRQRTDWEYVVLCTDRVSTESIITLAHVQCGQEISV